VLQNYDIVISCLITRGVSIPALISHEKTKLKSTILWDVTPCSPVKSFTDILEKNAVSIFDVEEKLKVETWKKQTQRNSC
jgi:hypothetical protein